MQALHGILDIPAELASPSDMEGGDRMTTYEVLSLVIAFLTLIVTILK